MATTVVKSGPGAAFLADVQTAMEAVVNKVNHAGGICGRRLVITYRDDGWSPTLGETFLKNFIQSGIFAIPVAPSSEGLNNLTNAHVISEKGVPVVGTDGMLISQYQQSWIWPVAVSTASSARLMVLKAKALGMNDYTKYSIVFDKNYKFGVEAADAFNAEVRRQFKHDVLGYNKDHNCQQNFCGIEAGQPSYGTDINRFTGGKTHDSVVAMFLEPSTALVWMSSPDSPKPPNANNVDNPLVWGAQPLFTRDFAVKCQSSCDGMSIWTGYKPPIENYQYDAKVRQFVTDMRSTNPQADVYNAFAEGGYVGMELLVKALQKVGPYLTRARLRAVLDSITLQAGLTVDDNLRWTEGNHFAARCMQQFTINYKGTFGGWRTGDTSCDKHPEYGTN
jgi:ABC-type branched-subunit amino acid transport system substrate-binding protein